MRSQAKAGWREPPGQESPVLEKQELYQSSQQKGVRRELGQDPRRGSGAPKFPGALTEELRPGGEHPHASGAPERAGALAHWSLRSGSGGSSTLRGLPTLGAGFRWSRPQSQGCWGTQPKIRCSPQGRAEARRAQESEDATAVGCLEPCRLAPTTPRVSRPLQTESSGGYCRS